MFELKARIKVIKDTQVVSEKFKKREFVATDESSQYPQDILFQLTQDNVDKMNGLKAGDVITIKFNLRGREWVNPQGEVKYFNSLDAWFIQKGEESVPVVAEAFTSSNNDDSGLPF